MNNLVSQDSLGLEVANFGPIIEAKIDLRPLTVFIGPSNTGKSYLAILIYALHSFFSSSVVHEIFWSHMPRKLPRRTIRAINEWAEQELTNWEKLKAKGSLVLPPPVTDEILAMLNTQSDQLGNEISRCFGIDETRALVRRGNRNGVRIIFQKHVENGSAPFDHELMIGTQEFKFKTTIPGETPIRINVGNTDRRINHLHRMVDSSLRSSRNDKERNSFIWELIELLIDPVLPQLVGPLCRPAFYLPADRTGVMHAHSVVVSAMIRRAPMTGLHPVTGTPMLSGVLADFLEQLIAIDPTPHRRHRPRLDLGRQIEESILYGAVRVERSETIGYPHFTYQPKGWKDSLPLMNASSMVSELAPVVLYLRYVVGPGNVLIIEEPESHLHPAMQVEFTRQIAALVHAGIRVIITTHSEWVLEELANIVRRSELPKARRKDIPKGEFALRSDQVGAWLFKQKMRPRGSVVEEIKLDAETGLYPTDYDDVSLALYNDGVDIFNRIQDRNTE